MRLIIAGGGTGGHLFPGISVAEEFVARDAANEVLFVGTSRGIESRIVPQLGMKLECVSASGVRGKNGLAQIKGAVLFLFGYSESRQILKRFRPDIVLGVGGYASAPLCLAARGMQIGYFIHEQNAIPGLTNRLLARFARQVFISLEESRRFFPQDKVMMTGNPLRKSILDLVAASEDTPAPATSEKFRILVFGGSQGARSINQAMIAALPHLAAMNNRIAIVHQTGQNDRDEVAEGYARSGVEAEVLPFIDDMAGAYRNADLVVCRAGATTIAEVTAAAKACLFIPFPHAVDDHQRKNAEALLKQDACLMLLEQELTGERLAGEIVRIMADPARLAAIAVNARRMARLDAARIIVDRMLAIKGTGHVR
ncbi:UDP-N-acetylglucosamine--N-acetylmuramyl-(pentapeptide) pyrophosphoryl-undecaprenol N-acetylglucosamine transferase [Geobacter sp. OR-1]|uniref:undecaprenyldiphospho-muramoylpentapeptide beta-N-acetylglucosaminyltransferase n=1 Tax=Geobacter sp. OR-1 TaxID=1266765 RepID=UPI00054405CE|nr:undecaprenyldiphospho-muramoylpentapeptide beta-N-acetylglucosaminyltransferase [Geobacter sp. OR-1]GAM09512.1 UDP-N-acetylglucosamine--N-acetylmuramyl-(pentapeptide) pyrophosphoryl-undecaprenol N-acetylglucosamine transferase [Geobacter sp. OR-1]